VLTNPSTNRLTVETVERIQNLIGGNAEVEGNCLLLIEHKMGLKPNLLYLGDKVAQGILDRPNDFLKAVKKFAQTIPF
jgi:hypothetical protein